MPPLLAWTAGAEPGACSEAVIPSTSRAGNMIPAGRDQRPGSSVFRVASRAAHISGKGQLKVTRFPSRLMEHFSRVSRRNSALRWSTVACCCKSILSGVVVDGCCASMRRRGAWSSRACRSSCRARKAWRSMPLRCRPSPFVDFGKQRVSPFNSFLTKRSTSTSSRG